MEIFQNPRAPRLLQAIRTHHTAGRKDCPVGKCRDRIGSCGAGAGSHLSERIRADGVRVRSLVLSGGDVRRQLAASIGEQAIDLLVLASHGHSGFADVPFGDVASYLIKSSNIPTMLIRFGGNATERHAFSQAQSKGVRSPGTLTQ